MDAVVFQNSVRTRHNAHVAACTLVLVVFHISGYRIFFHSSGHTGIYTFRSLTVPAEYGRRLCLTVYGHTVSSIRTLRLVADHTGSYTGQTADTAASVNFYTIHKAPPNISRTKPVSPCMTALLNRNHIETVSACCILYNESAHTAHHIVHCP